MTSTARIREIIRTHCRLKVDMDELDDSDDLFDQGMSSHASVNLMIAIEEEFGLVFPDSMIRKATFASIDAVREAIEQLSAPAQQPVPSFSADAYRNDGGPAERSRST